MRKDYFGILGVSKDASDEEIKKSFRKLAIRWHPDKNPGDGGAEEKFKEINEAYQTLSNPEKRREWETGGLMGNGSGIDFSNLDPETLRNMGFDFPDINVTSPGGLDDLFSTFFGGQAQKKKGKDVKLSLEITLEEAAIGIKKTINYHVGDCPICKGSGYKTIQYTEERNSFKQTMPCDKCEGIGQLGLEGGDEKLKITVPVGVEDGNKLKLTGKGVDGGDLYIEVKVKPHEHYRREGKDLYVDAELSIADAIFGADVEIPTLEGKKMIKIPAGAQPGAKMKLKGKGMPSRKKPAERGELYIALKVKIPKQEELTEEQKAFFQKMKEY